MFYLVFSEEDKEKMLLRGATLIQKQGNAFLFNVNKINFDKGDIECIKTKDINF